MKYLKLTTIVLLLAVVMVSCEDKKNGGLNGETYLEEYEKTPTWEEVLADSIVEKEHVGKECGVVCNNLDIATDRIIGTRHLDFRVVSTGRRDYKPLLFDNRGRMHLVNSLDDITNERVPVSGQVTSFASSKNEHLAAYGMADGTIWLIDKNGKLFKLVGHLSQISKMKLNGKRLYSSSYDGKLLFWMTDDPQIKPITLFQSNSWLTDFTFSSDKGYIWTGEHNGTITEYLISLPKIAQRLRQNVKRNFTKEEWDYYVGKGIPYKDIKRDE